MRWFSLAWQLIVTLGAASLLVWLLGAPIFLGICGVLFVGTVLWLLARDLSDAGGASIPFPRFLEILGMGVVIGLLWPIVPIVFAWADYRSRADEDDEGDA